ncbi:MAG: hypothetical protein JW889_12485 [Verrucomicrobia bacterium]|nr:hypothetical protein [Verrucomicrobiota bacterium]
MVFLRAGVRATAFGFTTKAGLSTRQEDAAAVLLRAVVCAGMVIFCVWQGIEAASAESPEGRHYLPIVYVLCPILLIAGLHPRGIVTWPAASVLLLVRGHFVLGWIPAGLVAFNLVGNKLVAGRRQRALMHVYERGAFLLCLSMYVFFVTSLWKHLAGELDAEQVEERGS